MSKRQRCIDIAIANPNASRQELMDMFINQVNLTYATANAYASSVKKEVAANISQRVDFEPDKPEETDEEIAARLEERFAVIDTLADASCAGQIRSLIISGPAGLGKSYTVEQAVKKYDPTGDHTVIAKGFVRPTGLYLLLHEYRHSGCVIVLDDADSIYNDMDALNLLKAACDTTKERRICWRAETKMQDADGEPIDREFTFEGTIIFITNKDFDAEIARGGRSAEHFEALVSRSHYVECDMHSIRDYLVRIKQVVDMGMLRKQRQMNDDDAQIIVDFINKHAEQLRELTLRMALKLADVYKLDPDNFDSLARVSCFKGGRH